MSQQASLKLDLERKSAVDRAAFAAKVAESVWSRVGQQLDSRLEADRQSWRTSLDAHVNALRADCGVSSAAAEDEEASAPIPASFAKAISTFTRKMSVENISDAKEHHGWQRLHDATHNDKAMAKEKDDKNKVLVQRERLTERRKPLPQPLPLPQLTAPLVVPHNRCSCSASGSWSG